MRKFLSLFLSAIMVLVCVQAFAVEVVRQKNVASYIVFPLVDADGDLVTGASSLDSEIDAFADGSAPDGFADCTNEATEIGTTGNYYLSLTNTELNQDYVIIQTKSASAKTQVILIRTLVGDPLNFAVTDDGGAINVTGGAVDTVTTTTTATNVTTVNGIASGAITAAAIATDAIGAAEIADGAIDAGALAADTITAAKIAADAIGASELATDAIGAAELAADAITSSEVADGAIDAGALATDTITAAKIAADSIGASEIAASAITSSEFAQSAADLIWGTTSRSITGLTAAALADFFDTDSATTYASAVAGSVVKETADNAGGSSLTVADIADGVWDEAQSGHVSAGTFGRLAQVIRDNTAQAGAAGTITLDASASASDDFYNNTIIQITGGTGAGQSRIVSDYVGSTKVASVNGNWVTNPSSDSVFVIRAFGAVPGATAPTAGEVADAVWDEAASGHVSAGTFGDYLDEAISGLDDNQWDNGTRTLTALDEDATTIDLDATTIGTVTTATNVTTVNGIASGAITAAAIATDAIGAAEIADGAIDAGALATDTITAAKIAASAITSSEAPNLDAAVTTRSSHSAADVWAAGTRTLTALDEDSTTLDLDATTIGTVSTVGDKTGYRLSATGVDDIWDEAQSGHATAGTFGKYLDAQVSTVGGGSAPTAAQIADAVWDETMADHVTAGTTGNKLNAAASAGDPWGTTVPGAYSAGTAGYVIGQIKDATDGDKEGGAYTGIENTIRINR